MAVKGKRKAEIELYLYDRTAAALKGAARNLTKFASSTPKSVAKGFGRAGMAIGRSLMTGFGMRGADLIVDAFGGLVDVERNLTRFQIAAGAGDDQMQSFRAKLLDVSNASGITRSSLLSGAQAYVAFTGDGRGATESLQLFGDVANATGATMTDITGVAGALLKNLKLDPSQFRAGFDILTTQGKAGAVEIKDLASEISNVAPMFSRFAGGSGLDGLAKMGSIMQVMRTDFGSVEETATGFKGIMSQLVRHYDRLKNKGINVFGKDKKPRAFLDIVDDIGKKIRDGKLSDADLIDLLGEQKAVNALNAVISRRSEVEQMANNARNSNAIAKDAATYQLSAAGKLDKAWTNIKNKLAEALTPERINGLAKALLAVADLFTALVAKISAIVGFISDFGAEANRKNTEKDLTTGLAAQREDRIRALQLGVTDMRTMQPTGAAPMSRTDAIKTLIKQARAEQSVLMRANSNGVIDSSGDGFGRYDAYVNDEIALQQMLKKPRNYMAEKAALTTGAFQAAPARSFADAAAGARTPTAAAPQSFANFPVFEVTFKVGETTFAKAIANDPSQRRKPGGMF